MKPNGRWPLHPAPMEGEALSSWVQRIAGVYDLSVPELLQRDLGPSSPDTEGLDFEPASAVTEFLAQRTGVARERMHRMSLSGWVPWLLDGTNTDPDGFETYVHQFSVLFPSSKRRLRPVDDWLAWIPDPPLQRACPQCLKDPDRQGLLLIWQLPLLLSCPEHGCLLERCTGFPGNDFEWTDGSARRRANDCVRAMDQRTNQALAVGHLRLPRRGIHAAIWFRLLRTIIDELSSPLSRLGSHASTLSQVWEETGYPLRSGQFKWCPIERSPWPVQRRLLEATACAIGLLEAGKIVGHSKDAVLFLPEPRREAESGAPLVYNPRLKAPFPAMTMGQTMAAMIQNAREDAAAAQTLYKFLLIGCRTPEAVTELEANFFELGIALKDVTNNKDNSL